MSLKSILQNRNLRRTFRNVRKGKLPINSLPPYERGLYYEDFVCRWLKTQGYHILDRNYRGRRRTELDIVAKEKETLVFIEVKARREFSAFDPLRAVDERKRQALALASKDYLNDLELSGIDTSEISVRYDVIALAFNREGTPASLDHYISYLVPSRERI